jgi:hypothetical protein
MIEEEVKDINYNLWDKRDVIKKNLIRFGLICLSIGLVLGFITVWFLNKIFWV